MKKTAFKFPSDQYRVVTDNILGFELQIKRWWFPVWFQSWIEGPTTFSTVEQALEWLNGPKGRNFKSVELTRGKL